MRDSNRTSESRREHHRVPRRAGGRVGQERIPLEPPLRPEGRARAYDGAEAEQRAAGSWDGIERRRQDRRRGDERRDGRERRSGPDRRGLMAHARDFAVKFKEPLIGLGVAAAAMPAIRATTRRPEDSAPDRASEQASASAEANAAVTAARQPDRDIDAEVGARWSNTERVQTIDAAVNTYNIDPQLAANIYDHAKNEGVDPKLAFGLVKTESSFKHTAVSNVGARGLTQLMPRTASWLQPGTKPADLFKPEVSLQVGFRYLRHLMDKYNGNAHLALTAYNRGPGIVDRAVSHGRDPDNGYAGAVLGNALHHADGGSAANTGNGG